MKKKQADNLILVSLRVQPELLERAEALLPALRADPDLAAWRITRLGVLRLAIIHGLDDLEEAYGGKRGK